MCAIARLLNSDDLFLRLLQGGYTSLYARPDESMIPLALCTTIPSSANLASVADQQDGQEDVQHQH